jgi:CBS domain-containing protein
VQDPDWVGYWMQAPVATCSPDHGLSELAELLARHDLPEVAVTDAEGKLLGVVSRLTALDHLQTKQQYMQSWSDSAMRSLLGQQNAAQLMCPYTYVVSADSTVADVTRQTMFPPAKGQQYRYPLPVVDDGELVGFLSTRDLIRAIRAKRTRGDGQKRS